MQNAKIKNRNRRSITLAISAFVVGVIAAMASHNAALASEERSGAINAAIADPSRLASHRERDASRKPADMLALVKASPGDRFADLAAGSGYYTALLSRITGAEGKVYAVDPILIFEAFPNASKTFPKFLEDDPRDNVDYSVQRFDDLMFPEKLDAIIMGLYYHDTIWTGENRSRMNAAIYDALKPGGLYLVIDHHALPGAGDAVTQELHRMDGSIVQPEVLAAGFDLEAVSDALANPDDPRTASVFDPAIRGKTDRFIYLFRKPD